MLTRTSKFLLQAVTPRIVKKAVSRLGRFYATVDEVPEAQEFPSQQATLRTLKQLGWSPQACIDVGAYHGEWTTMFLEIFPHAHSLMIEPQESKQAKLTQVAAQYAGRAVVETALLGARAGTVVDFAEMETGSSVFAEASHIPRTITRKTLTTLDHVVADRTEWRSPQCVKLDTQGYELEVLKGSQQTLSVVDVMLMEVSLVQINEGCPLIAEVVAYMDRAGFQIFDFCSQIRRRDGVLWQTDLCFVRRDGPVRILPHLNPMNW